MRDATAKQPPVSPPELVATVGIGANLDPLRAYVDSVRPGTSMVLSDAMIRAQLAGAVHATSLDALDPAAGTYLLVVTSGDTFAMALAGKVRDPARLAKDTAATHVETQGGWAVVGDPAVTKIVAPYALAVLPAHPVPSSFVAELEVPRLVAKFQPMIAGAHERAKRMFADPAQSASPVLAAAIDGVFGMVDDIDRAVITLDAAKDLVALDIALAPKPHSRIAKFVAAQHPSEFSLLGKLPELVPMMVLAGRFDAGPYRQGMIEVMGALYSAGSTDKAVTAAFDAIMKAATGEVAMAATAFPQHSAQVFAIDDPKHVDQAVDALAKALATARSFDMRGVTTTVQTQTKAERKGDARLAEFTFDYDTSHAAKATRDAMAKTVAQHNVEEVGTVGKLGMVAMDLDPAVVADAIRGTGKALAVDPQFAGQLAAARARKDSVASMLDLGVVRKVASPLPVFMILGFADGRAHMRFAVPATTAFGFAKL